MSNRKVVVFAGFKAKAGQESQLEKELLDLIDSTRQEEGCLQYELYRDSSDPSSFMFHEVWNSRGDLDRHLQTAKLVRLLGLVPELCTEDPMVKLTEKLA